MARTDLIGTWDFMGIIAPRFGEWRRFTFETSSPYQTILINCLAVPDRPLTVGYIRAVFFTPDAIYSPWLKFFPKQEKELYTIPIPPEVLRTADGLRRGFEIIKSAKRKPTYQTVREHDWSVSLEVLSKTGLPDPMDFGEIEIDDPLPSPDPLSPSSIWDQLLG